MGDHKLIFVGPVGAGKTTAIATLSDHDIISTDAKATDITGQRKATTTVALDYGSLQTGSQKIKLYGAPGQIRFSFMWDVLANELAADTAAVILMLDNTRNAPQRDLAFYVKEFKTLIEDSQLIVAITHTDEKPTPTLAHYHTWLEQLGVSASVLFADARDHEQLLQLLHKALPEVVAAPNMPVTPTSHDAPQSAPAPYQESIKMKDTILNDVMKIRGVTGAILANPMGDILNSSNEDPALEEYLGYIAGMIPAFQSASSFDTARSIHLKSQQGENLTVFIEQEQILGVLSAQRASLRSVKQQVEDLLQWS